MAKTKDKTLGFKETDAYFTQFQKEMELDGFKNQSDYLRHLIECQRHFRNFGAREFFRLVKGTTARVYNAKGERIPITFNSEKDVIEYLMRVQEGYRFFIERILFRPDLANQLLAIDMGELQQFLNQRKLAKADQNLKKTLVAEVQL